MKIALAVPAYAPAWGYGGPVTNVQVLAQGLRRQGHEVIVITSTLADDRGGRLAPGRAEDDGIPVLRLPTQFAYRWAPWVAWRVPANGIDMLHVFGAWNGFSYAAIGWARRSRIPCIWEPSGMLGSCGRKRLIKRVLHKVNARYARLTSGLLWTSRVERQEAPRTIQGRPHWFRPNPVPDMAAVTKLSMAEAREQLGWPVDGIVYGYLGRIAERKGVDTLLAAWELSGTAASLALAGPGESERLVKRMAEGRQRGVHYLGSVQGGRKQAFLAAIDVLVLVPACGENFGIVVTEALAAGTPVLATEAVGAAEWLRGCGVSIVPAGIEQLSALFRDLHIPDQEPTVPPDLSMENIATRMARIYGEIESHDRAAD